MQCLQSLSQPINAHSGQNQPDNFDEIFQAKAELAKFLKEKCSLEYYPQVSFKYSVKIFLIQKLSSKVSRRQFLEKLVNGLNHCLKYPAQARDWYL